MRAFREFTHEAIRKLLSDINASNNNIAINRSTLGKESKNLFKLKIVISMVELLSGESRTVNGVDITNNGDGSFGMVAHSPSVAPFSISIADVNILQDIFTIGFTGVLSVIGATQGSPCNFTLSYKQFGSTKSKSVIADGESFTIPPNSIISAIGVFVPAGSVINLPEIRLQLEIGTEATDFEAYQPSVSEKIDMLATQMDGLSFRVLTKSAYDDLPTKDENTLYIIKG